MAIPLGNIVNIILKLQGSLVHTLIQLNLDNESDWFTFGHVQHEDRKLLGLLVNQRPFFKN